MAKTEKTHRKTTSQSCTGTRSLKATRSSRSGKFVSIGKTYDGILVARPHLPPKNVKLKKLREAVADAKAAEPA